LHSRFADRRRDWLGRRRLPMSQHPHADAARDHDSDNDAPAFHGSSNG
jgi:hypothetical protein